MASTTPITNTSFFRPTGIPGCALWLDAADASSVIRTGANVTQWRDKSGSNNNALAGTATYPVYSPNSLNGLPVIQLRASNDYFIVANNFTYSEYPSLTYFIVMKPHSSQTSGSALGILSTDTPGTYGRSLMFNTSPGYYRQEYYSNFRDITTYSSTRWDVLSLQFNTTVSATFTLNGVLSNLTATATGTNTCNFIIGSAPGGPVGNQSYTTFNANLDIGEILVYGASLTTGQRQQVEGYLSWKWGLQNSLPANHPYYTNPQQSTYPYTLLRTIPQPQTSLPSWSFFSPRSIPSCSLWLDAADATSFQFSNAANISNWNDKSGNGRNFTLVGSTSPVLLPNIQNGQSVVSFNGTNQRLSNTTFAFPNSAYTVFSLHLLTSTVGNQAGYQRLVSTDGFFFIGAINATVAVFTGANSWNDIAALTPPFNNSNQWALVSTYSAPSGSSNTLFNFINGTQYNTKNGTTSNFTGLTVGGWTATQQQWNGYFAEFLVYSRVLSTGERQQVEGYIALKWGLQPTLAAAHPTKANFLYPILPLLPAVTQSVAPSPINPNSRFVPTSVSGLALWLDAADVSRMTLVGTNITQYIDKSPNNIVLSNSTTSNQPQLVLDTNNNRNILFNGVSQTLQNASVAASNLILNNEASIFFVHSPTNTTNSIIAWTTSGNPRINFHTPEGGSAFMFDFIAAGVNGRLEISIPNYTTSGRRLDGGYRRGTTQVIRSYGSELITRTNTLTITGSTSAQLTFGAFGPFGYYYSGRVYEIVWYNRGLNNNEITQVEGYLAWKWGLRSSLPSTHPNAFMPP